VKSYLRSDQSIWESRARLPTEDCGALRLTPEESLLLLTCRPRLNEADSVAITNIVDDRLDWNYVIWRSEMLRTTPLVWYFLRTLNLTDQVPEGPAAYFQLWDALSTARSRLAYAELLSISAALRASGISHFLLKGAALGPLYYPNPFMRPMLDLDIMILPDAIPTVRQELVRMGYLHAYWDYQTNHLAPLAPNEILGHFETHYELPGFVKLRYLRVPLPGVRIPRSLRQKHIKFFVGRYQTVCFPIFVDIHFNLSIGFDLVDVWRGTVAEHIFGQPVHVQSPTAMVWFLASRLYHETFQSNTQKLIMLSDLGAILEHRSRDIDWEELLSVAERYGLQPPLFYVLSHLKALFTADVPDKALARLRPDNTSKPHGHLEELARSR